MSNHGRVFVPIWTEFLGSCCLDAIRAKQDEECEGLAIRCPKCGNPMEVINGAWSFHAGYTDADVS